MRLRKRDCGFGHHNTELMIVVAIIGILAAIAIPNILKLRDRRGPDCLKNVVLLAEGPLPANTVCPYSEKPYAAGDVVACPSPEGHLDSKPRMLRPREGPWRLQQTLPPSAKPIDFMSARLEVVEHPGRAAVLVKPGAFIRFFFGPAIFLVFTVAGLAAIGSFVAEARKKNWGEAVPSVFGLAISGVIVYFSLMGFATSHEWVVERAGARVTRVEYAFGSRRSEKTLAGCLGVVPTKRHKGQQLQLLHPPEADGRRMTELGLVSDDRLDVAEWFNRKLLGP